MLQEITMIIKDLNYREQVDNTSTIRGGFLSIIPPSTSEDKTVINDTVVARSQISYGGFSFGTKSAFTNLLKSEQFSGAVSGGFRASSATSIASIASSSDDEILT
jgi:hypothetical protein